MAKQYNSLPENWEELDSIDSYYEAMRAIGERVKAGEIELPDIFKARRETEKQ